METTTKKQVRNRTRTRSSVGANGMGREARIAQRNKVLIARWYYWTECRRMRTDDAIRRLCDEFFIEERTVQNAILDCDMYFRELLDNKTTKTALKRMYDAYSWE